MLFAEFVDAVVGAVESHEDFRAVVRRVHHDACRIVHDRAFSGPLVDAVNRVDSLHFSAVLRGESPQEAARSALGCLAAGVPDSIVDFVVRGFGPLLGEELTFSVAEVRAIIEAGE